LASVGMLVIFLGRPLSGFAGLLIAVGFATFVMSPLWIYLGIRSARIGRAAAGFARAGEIRVLELWPEWQALGREKSRDRLAADEAILSLTGLDVELYPHRMPKHLEIVGDAVLVRDSDPARDFRWLGQT